MIVRRWLSIFWLGGLVDAGLLHQEGFKNFANLEAGGVAIFLRGNWMRWASRAKIAIRMKCCKCRR